MTSANLASLLMGFMMRIIRSYKSLVLKMSFIMPFVTIVTTGLLASGSNAQIVPTTTYANNALIGKEFMYLPTPSSKSTNLIPEDAHILQAEVALMAAARATILPHNAILWNLLSNQPSKKPQSLMARLNKMFLRYHLLLSFHQKQKNPLNLQRNQ